MGLNPLVNVCGMLMGFQSKRHGERRSEVGATVDGILPVGDIGDVAEARFTRSDRTIQAWRCPPRGGIVAIECRERELVQVVAQRSFRGDLQIWERHHLKFMAHQGEVHCSKLSTKVGNVRDCCNRMPMVEVHVTSQNTGSLSVDAVAKPLPLKSHGKGVGQTPPSSPQGFHPRRRKNPRPEPLKVQPPSAFTLMVAAHAPS